LFDTAVTIIGNVLTNPEFRRLHDSQVVVSNFRIASTARRFDRVTNNWVDGSTLRVRVNCWRRLAENVCDCLSVGDPVIVTGRLFSRDWTGEDGIRRTSYELDAFAVGHDLARGRDTFTRFRPSMGTSSIEDAEADRRADTELGTRVSRLEDRRLGDRAFTGRDLDGFGAGLVGAGFSGDEDPFQGFRTDEPDVLATLTNGGPDTEDFPDAAVVTVEEEEGPDETGDGEDTEDAEPEADDEAATGQARPKRRRRAAAGV
jgi:single-strand DNA-binding protein